MADPFAMVSQVGVKPSQVSVQNLCCCCCCWLPGLMQGFLSTPLLGFRRRLQ